MLTKRIRFALRWNFNKFHIRKNSVSVTMSSGTKMKALLLIFFLTAVSAEQFVTMRLQDIADKYRYQSFGNGEFSGWVEKVYYAARKPMGNKAEKDKILHEFMAYDTQRQYLEDKITDRINEIESLLPNRRLSQICVTDYQAQQSRLERAFKFSNSAKQGIIDKNSNRCNEKDEPAWKPPPPPPPPPPPSSITEHVYHHYNTNYWYWWWWG